MVGWNGPILVFVAVFFLGCGIVWCVQGDEHIHDGEMPFATSIDEGEYVSIEDEPFDFPMGTRIIFDEPSSRGWRQTGCFQLAFVDALDYVRGVMMRRGYAERNKIAGPNDENRCLIYWESAAEHILWTMWSIDENHTGFSWGRAK